MFRDNLSVPYSKGKQSKKTAHKHSFLGVRSSQARQRKSEKIQFTFALMRPEKRTQKVREMNLEKGSMVSIGIVNADMNRPLNK